MQCIYSTTESQVARRLAAALARTGIECHVSGEHVTATPGIHRTPAAIGVWLMQPEDLPKARSVMAAQGLLVPQSQPRPLKRVHPLLLIVGIALLFGLLVICCQLGDEDRLGLSIQAGRIPNIDAGKKDKFVDRATQDCLATRQYTTTYLACVKASKSTDEWQKCGPLVQGAN